MPKKLLTLASVMVLAAGLVFPAAGAAAQNPEAPGAAVRLKAGTFNPAGGESLSIPPGLAIAGYAAGSDGYYIVQFAGPVQQAWKDAATAAGAELLDYLPDFAFKARMTPAASAAVAALGSVAWVGVFQPAYKLNPGLDVAANSLYRVEVERGADAGLATAAINATGASILKRSDNTLLITADAAQLEAIANVLDVAWVDVFQFKQKHNESGGGIIMGANTAIASGYDGSTQIAAVADTGIGDGTPPGAHPDIPASRVTAIYNWTTSNARGCYRVRKDGAQDVDSGHGTHTAVSVLGDGDAGGQGRGTAPAAGLVFQAVEEYLDTYGGCAGSPDGYYLVGLPDDLHDLYQQAYNAGARIHSNSWGSDVSGDYTQDSADTDDFVWDNPDMTVTFSAGNAGTDGNANGVVDNDSIGSPATAKNVITVGASENARTDNWPCDTGLGYTSHDAYQTGQTCSSMGGQNLLGTWGQRYPADFPAGPLADDVTAGNAAQMASWSSRGPTDDGRIKPDVVAPGTWILSGYSSLYQEGYGDPVNPRNDIFQWDGWGMPVNDAYKYMGGTSMSNPLVAGAATVVRDFYQKTATHNASAALVKATIINSAIDMADENNDGADDNDFPIPNVHEGWGRVDLANATDGSHQYVDDATGVATGGAASHQYTVVNAGSPFKVSLVWSDFAASAAAGADLVNDLDLTVTAPSGTTVYHGNVFSGGWATTGGSADRVNNVENVYVQSAAAGTWTVEVSGFNVPQGATQPFAIVVDGELGGAPDTPPAVSIANPVEGATVSGASVLVAATASDDNGVTQVEFFVDGGSIGVDATAPYSLNWDSTSVGDGARVVSATATDTIGQTATDSNNVTVNNVVDAVVHVGDLDGTATAAARGKWSATVTITVHDAAENPVANATVSGSWSSGVNGSGSCITNASGQCSITKNGIKKNSSSVTFTVTGVAASGSTYNSGANHDPDGDSNGTTIVIAAP